MDSASRKGGMFFKVCSVTLRSTGDTVNWTSNECSRGLQERCHKDMPELKLLTVRRPTGSGKDCLEGSCRCALRREEKGTVSTVLMAMERGSGNICLRLYEEGCAGEHGVKENDVGELEVCDCL